MGQPRPRFAQERNALARGFRPQRVEDALIECLNEFVNRHRVHLLLSARHGGHYLYGASVFDSSHGPFGATYDLAVDCHRHTARLNRKSSQHRFD
jgi:hypothetical protein